MEEQRVTVGMPVYNDPDGLRRSVPTVFGQTWPGAIRLLIVDDGSTDETPDVIASLAATYGRIDLVRHPQNLGRPFARNRILDLASDEYLAWVDAGDLWHPRKLELQLGALLAEEDRDPDTPLLCTGPLRWAFTDRGHNRIRVPDVSGDQLYGVLAGTLYPYLPSLVGKAAHFRDVGFDDRLLRRQDYDFLVRFIGRGGRVVSSPSSIPVFTYLKSDIGTSPRMVAAANRVIRKNHRPYYRMYGWHFECQVRSKQHRLVARYYQHNGRTLLALSSRMRERLWRASTSMLTMRSDDKAAGSLGARVKRLRRGGGSVLSRPLSLMAAYYRLIKIGRQVAVTWLLDTVKLGQRHLSEPARSSGRGSQVVPSIEPPMWIAKLEAEANAPALTAEPELWLRLARAYSDRDLLHSAESTLRRGLELCHEDPRLLAQLVEVLSLRRRWGECVEVWSGLSDCDKQYCCTGRTYARVARSFRAIQRSTDALAVASEGVRSSPADPHVRNEVYLNRAALVDWKQAISALSATSDARVHRQVGVVADLGFLTGSHRPMEGYLYGSRAANEPIFLLVNGRQLAVTYAGVQSPGRERSSFLFSCRDLLPYLGNGDTISVQCAGGVLNIDGYGSGLELLPGYESRFNELAGKLSEGFVFTSTGMLRKQPTALDREQLLKLFTQVLSILETQYSYVGYPLYGALLGAIREHDLIGYDPDGFDMGYVSNCRRPHDVRAEFLGICQLLLERGYRLRIKPWGAQIRSEHTGDARVDITYAWFNEANELRFSSGSRGSPTTDRARFFAPREALIGNHLVRVPGNAEDVLEQIYGPSWAIPDQGFCLRPGLNRDAELLLTSEEMLRLERMDPDHVEARLEHHPTGIGIEAWVD